MGRAGQPARRLPPRPGGDGDGASGAPARPPDDLRLLPGAAPHRPRRPARPGASGRPPPEHGRGRARPGRRAPGSTRWPHSSATFRTRIPPPGQPTWPAPTSHPSDDCLGPELVEEAEGEVINLHRRLLLRCHPRTGWLRGTPSGIAELEGWLRFADGRAPDPVALLMFSDGMPPSLFEVTGRDVVGHVPTVQLTTHLFARPADGWVQARSGPKSRGAASSTRTASCGTPTAASSPPPASSP